MMSKALLVTSHENYAVTPPHSMEVSVYLVSAEVDLHDAAKDIRTQCNDVSTLFVDINLQAGALTDGTSPTAGGLALVKWLRIMGVRTSIVVLSDKRLETLLKEDAGNMVLASPGTFVTERGPDLARLFTDSVTQEPTVAPEPPPKRSWLRRLFGHQALPAAPIEQNTGRIPRKPPAVPLNLENVLRSQAPEDTKKLAPYFKAGLQLSRDAKHDWANWWGMYVLLRSEEASGTGDVHYPGSLKHAFRDLRNQTALLVHGDGWQELPDQAAAVEKKPTKRLEGRRIVFVDDQADEGWAQVLRRVLYGSLEEKVDGFTVLSPKPGELADVAAYYNGKDGQPGKLMPALYPQETNANPFSGAELLIMDVRLDTENDPEAITDKISGIRMLRHVREKDPGLPILVFTASQSGDVHRMLLDAGADLIWTKSGLDARGAADFMQDSVTKLAELKSHVDRLLCREYQVVRKCGVLFAAMKRSPAIPWWRLERLPAVTISNAAGYAVTYQQKQLSTDMSGHAGLVEEVLREGLQDVRQHHRDLFTRKGGSLPTDAVNRAQVISRLGSLVELIHSKPRGALDGKVLADLTLGPSRGDYIGFLILQARHNGSHIQSMRKCSMEDLLTMMCAMFLYLKVCPINAVNPNDWVTYNTYDKLRHEPWWSKVGEADDLDKLLRKALSNSAKHASLFTEFGL